MILLTALPPIVLFALVLSTYVINARLDDLDKAFRDRGEASAQQVASAAVLGLFTGDERMLQTVCLRHLGLSEDIQRITIRDRRQDIVAQAARSTTSTDGDRLMTFSAAVVAPLLELHDEEMPLHTPAPIGEVSVRFSRHSADLAASRIIRNAIVISALAVFITLLVTALVGRQIAAPLVRLRRAFHRIRQGDLDARVPEGSDGELGDLEKGFNAMAGRIAASTETMQQEVAQATSDLQSTMDALESRNVELESARRRALEASRAKSGFLANMSHEIRTPMNGVLGFAGLLKKTRLNATQQEFLDTIVRSAEDLLSTINDILDFSKLESGRVDLEHIPFSIRDAIDDAVGLLVPQAQDKRLEMLSFVDRHVPDTLIGDATRLRHILTNLLGNAVKFTEAGEVVLWTEVIERAPGNVRLEINVCDSGIGIPQDIIGQLFAPFNQGALSTTRLYGGTGLGLSICRALADAMGGSIAVRSQAGQGACFSVRIPFDIDVSAGHQPPARVDSPPLKVALYDRHPVSRGALRQTLKEAGMAVEVWDELAAPDPVDSPDVLLLSLSGFPDEREIAEQLERARSHCSAPLCVLLNEGHPDRLQFCSDKGACCTLEKPVRRVQLLPAIRQCIADGRQAAGAVRDASLEVDRWLQDRIFIVADDNPINLQLIEALLRSYGAKTMAASDGEEAVQLAESNIADMLLMDVHMPRLDGIEAARQIHANPLTRELPIVALTADATMEEKLCAAQGDFSACLINPVDETGLRAAIASALALQSKGTDESPEDSPPCPTPETDPPVRDRPQAVSLAGGNEATADQLFDALLRGLP